MSDRQLRKEVPLDATPEEVWAAIATGPGISAWFVPHEVEPREGGELRQDFGSGFVTHGRVTAWEPGRRFAYGAFDEQPDGAADYAFEFIVEGRDGGSTLLRFVQSGFLDEGWEDEYDSLDKGWNLFFANLVAYLEHFRGRPVTNVVAMSFVPFGAAEAWPLFYRALGLRQVPVVGVRVLLTPDGFDPISGTVDVATPEFLGVRTDDALYRFGAERDEGCGVSTYHYLYGPVDGAAASATWQRWLAATFPVPASHQRPDQTGVRA